MALRLGPPAPDCAHEHVVFYGVRNYEQDSKEKPSWTQTGTAFGCKDASLNTVLDHVPLGGGTIDIRPFRKRPAG